MSKLPLSNPSFFTGYGTVYVKNSYKHFANGYDDNRYGHHGNGNGYGQHGNAVDYYKSYDNYGTYEGYEAKISPGTHTP